MTKLRLAIVGAGPAGIYAADILLKAERKFDVSIDLFDQLPAPYGLVRYGVAPDHPRIKGIITALREVLDRGDIRLFGNVRFGEDITLDDLKQHYNAVIFATGAIRDADLGIPGIDAEGSYGAADFVSWYDGHPDFPREWPLDAASVAVIGNGNVALDVARMLAKHAVDLLPTEIPDNVHAGLEASAVTDVHVFGRRGPAQVKFTPLELRELGELRDVDMVVYDEDFDYDEASKAAIASNKQVMVIDRVLQSWRQRPSVNNARGEASRRLHLHFYARPVEVRKDDAGRVAGIVYERTRPDGQGGVVGTGELREVPVQAVYRAVGYFGSPLPGVPFDKRHGVIPNREGQVLSKDSNQRVSGIYATGWIKRGPVGLIGHTKSDAMETIR
ncbi:MAG: FAD-dependent oxidoreductase, partial [Microbacterium sp.]|nr:FAD-dependent oxidoreductase [Microbacterium sp.]